MPDTFTVENEPIPVDASPEGGKTVHHLHGGTIRYRNTEESVETGEALEVGDSVTTSQRLWLIADNFTPRRPSSSRSRRFWGSRSRRSAERSANFRSPEIHPSAVDPGNASAPTRRTPHE